MPSYNKEIRKQILKLLKNGQPCYVSKVARAVNTTRITAKKHLERLNKEGIAEQIREGRVCLFRIKNER
jgi:DNA-binding transcriptional ArsR family regulator